MRTLTQFILSIIFAVAVPLYGSANENIRTLIRQPFFTEAYPVPEIHSDEEIKIWLQAIINVLENELQSSNAEDTQSSIFPTELLLGDAYHWLGHYLEYKGNLIAAFHAHKKSLEYHLAGREYENTALASPQINFLSTVRHCHIHLRKLANFLYEPVDASWIHTEENPPRPDFITEFSIETSYNEETNAFIANINDEFKRLLGSKSSCSSLLKSKAG